MKLILRLHSIERNTLPVQLPPQLLLLLLPQTIMIGHLNNNYNNLNNPPLVYSQQYSQLVKPLKLHLVWQTMGVKSLLNHRNYTLSILKE